MANLAKIHRLDVIQASVGDHQHTGFLQQEHYLKEVLVAYRAMVMNFCSIVLTICLNIASAQYEIYTEVKDQAERVEGKKDN